MSHVRRLANGRWQARFRGPDGREHARHFVRKVDATRFLTTVDASKLRGEWADPQLGRMKLEDFWGTLQRKLATRIRPSTLALYEMLWRLHIGPGLGRRSVASITRYRVEELVAGLEEQGVGEASIGAALRLLHRILEAAVADGLVTANQAHGVRPPALPHRPMRFLTVDEVERLVDATPDDWKAFVMLGAWGGLRFGEMAALTTDRVDFERNQVRVEETLAEVGGHLHIGPTKTKAYRSVALPSFVMDAVRARFQTWPRERRLVFWSPEGGPVRRSNFRARVWLPAVLGAGLEPLRIHDLRHTAVALAVAAGAHPKSIQARLGHSSVAMTLDRYGHLLEGLDADVAARLEGLRNASRKNGRGLSADSREVKWRTETTTTLKAEE